MTSHPIVHLIEVAVHRVGVFMKHTHMMCTPSSNRVLVETRLLVIPVQSLGVWYDTPHLHFLPMVYPPLPFTFV